MSAVTIAQLWVPDSLDAPDAADFLAAVEIGRQVRIATWGNADLAHTPEEMLQAFSDPYERYVVLLARHGSSIVGRAGIAMPLADSTDLAHITLDVLPDAQGHGIGRELLEAAEQYARGENRRVLMVETNHPAAALHQEPGAAGGIAALSGTGTLPLSSREARFAQRADYELQSVQQFSACSLPLAPELVHRLRHEAQNGQHQPYLVHSWLDRCPENLLPDMARLELVLDHAPGEVLAEQATDASELIRESEAMAASRGRHTLVTAVELAASRHLVGFTTISVLGQRQDIVFQDDTLVLEEHWGDELGLLIKVVNMEQLALRFPLARKIYTWNSPESAYLLQVNAKLGFRPAGVTGQWRKNLDYLA
jgi:GNAT superfamily N-acetyltransferase